MSDIEDEDDEAGEDAPAISASKNYMTPAGHAVLQEELRWLLREERPRIVEVVSWAAGNGDRSENGDYLYNKKRLREIDRRVRYLIKRLDRPEIVDPRKQQGLEQVFFGATVTYAREDNTENTVMLVGVDEADAGKGKINWQSPMAQALMKGRVGDSRRMRSDMGSEMIEIVEIRYLTD